MFTDANYNPLPVSDVNGTNDVELTVLLNLDRLSLNTFSNGNRARKTSDVLDSAIFRRNTGFALCGVGVGLGTLGVSGVGALFTFPLAIIGGALGVVMLSSWLWVRHTDPNHPIRLKSAPVLRCDKELGDLVRHCDYDPKPTDRLENPKLETFGGNRAKSVIIGYTPFSKLVFTMCTGEVVRVEMENKDGGEYYKDGRTTPVTVDHLDLYEDRRDRDLTYRFDRANAKVCYLPRVTVQDGTCGLISRNQTIYEMLRANKVVLVLHERISSYCINLLYTILTTYAFSIQKKQVYVVIACDKVETAKKKMCSEQVIREIAYQVLNRHFLDNRRTHSEEEVTTCINDLKEVFSAALYISEHESKAEDTIRRLTRLRMTLNEGIDSCIPPKDFEVNFSGKLRDAWYG